MECQSTIEMLEMEGIERLFSGSSYGVVGQTYSIREEENGEIRSRTLEVIQKFPKVFEEQRGYLLSSHSTITFHYKKNLSHLESTPI